MTPPHANLLGRVEEACFNAWPGVRQVLLDGWLLRLASGHTRRANSVTVIRQDAHDLDARIAACEVIYGREGQPAIFRIVQGTAPELEQALDARGYRPAEDETICLHMTFRQDRIAPDPALTLTAEPGADWLDALAWQNGHTAETRKVHQRMMEAVSGPKIFAAVRRTNGDIVGLGYGAVHQGLVCVNSMVTDPRMRRQGIAQRVLTQIHGWARANTGATGACLNVLANNTPAVTLYRRIGYATEAGRYHYRRQGTQHVP